VKSIIPTNHFSEIPDELPGKPGEDGGIGLAVRGGWEQKAVFLLSL